MGMSNMDSDDILNTSKANTDSEEILNASKANMDSEYILKADTYRTQGKIAEFLGAVRDGLACNPENYELYYMLGEYYESEVQNENQAYLCFQNALFHCTEEEDKTIIAQTMGILVQSGNVQVKKTVILIVAYNAMHLQRKCIESIRRTLPEGTYQVLVVDNASTDGITQWLENQKDIVLIKNEENPGFSVACNQGAAKMEELGLGDCDLFLLNNDTQLADNSMFWLKLGLYQSDKIGACGACSNYAGNEQQLDVTFSAPEQYLKFGRKNNILMENPYEERVRLSGFAMLIRHGLWSRVGGMDEDFAPGYFEDDDLSMKLLKAGYRLVFCHNAFIYHAGSQSFMLRNDVNRLLLDHQQLFIEKYGFDILEYALPNKKQIAKQFKENVSYGKEDPFNLLVIGSGLGADMKYIRSLYPKANVVGIEDNAEVRRICSKGEVIFSSAAELGNVISSPVFHLVYISQRGMQEISTEALQTLADLCQPGCRFLQEKEEPDAGMDFKDIKLVIWDMDHTFWNGILSEGTVIPVQENVELVKRLADCGVINSISSKNNEADVLQKLREMSLEDYFVFNDINWEDKGSQITKKLQDMGLRAKNTLFLDDEKRNLEDAQYFNAGIMTAGPEMIPSLLAYYRNVEAKDISHKRLRQYRELEVRREAKKNYASNEDFLRASEIRLEIDYNCMAQMQRVEELIARTNQLNFTKLRSTSEEIRRDLEDVSMRTGLIRVWDNFCDYGIVGFFCLDTGKNELKHFLFSCRIIGMGVEQYIYERLGSPVLFPVQPVVSELVKGKEIPWIMEDIYPGEVAQGRRNISDKGLEPWASQGRRIESGKESEPWAAQGRRNISDKGLEPWASQDGKIESGKESEPDISDGRIHILLKGPCDISALEGFLIGGALTSEFNYVNDRGFITAGQNHSMNIVESARLTSEELDRIYQEVPFITAGDFTTSIFDARYHVIVMSLLPDCHAGLYRNKKTDHYINFGSKNFDLTDRANFEGYIDGTIVNHAFPFTEDILDKFAAEWEFVGVTPTEQLIDNFSYIYEHVKGKPQFILMLGSELEYQGENAEFANQSQIHAKVNRSMEKFAEGKERIHLVNMTDFIHSQADYEDCINHFKRYVYHDLAAKVVEIINGCSY